MIGLRRSRERKRSCVPSELTSVPTGEGLRWGNWKLLCEYDGSDTELFNLAADPSETKNVASEHAAIAERLTKQTVAWHESMPPDNGATHQEKRRK